MVGMGRKVAGETARRRAAALAGHRADQDAARSYLRDPAANVRATALAALARMCALGPEDLAVALSDPDGLLRRRACELAASVPEPDLVPLLDDREPAVVEMAAWALGEREDPVAVDALSRVATGHADALCREAAVAALGAIGDERGLPAILAATADKPAVRRRAVIALAPFEGPDVDAALQRSLEDRDWQVRQAAEDLLSPGT